MNKGFNEQKSPNLFQILVDVINKDLPKEVEVTDHNRYHKSKLILSTKEMLIASIILTAYQ